MSKTKSTSRCRKWQLTINNPMEHKMEHKAIKEILNTFPSLVYWCMGDEIGMETNTYHTHLFLSAKHPIRFTTLKNKFPMAHIECANGSSQENKNYILKCGKWEDTSKVETRVDGTFEDYACQDVIIFEEFDGSMPFDKLLHYLQKYPFKVGNTYHRNVACYTKIYIISTLPLQYQYRNEQQDEDYFSRMFLDRINTITYCKGEEEEIEHGLDIYYIEDDGFLPFQDEDTPTPLD